MAEEAPSALLGRLRFRGSPAPNPDNVVICGNARFTILASRLIRLEWSSSGAFEDRATYAFPTRWAPAVTFSAQVEAGEVTVDTGALVLRYRPEDGPFTPENLSISFELNGRWESWRPGLADPSNLRGARRTLDGCEGDAALSPGLVSRAGWALVDESQAVLFDAGGWVTARPNHPQQDWYFFGYGHDYQAAVSEYTRFGGQTPLIPRFVLGAWWSRYWAYSAEELKQVVRDFEAHDLPLDVLVIDMDWHTPDSWTGYTWNRELFPDPEGFLHWVHEKGLRTTLNLHPAEGVQAFEEVYPRFCEAMGQDPAKKEAVPCRLTDVKFIQNYFQLLHHPMEEQGVDFWWMDWQQGESSEMPGLDPLPWINHLHFQDSARRGRRPLLYSRWGGLGSHRYPIGFSGDTIVVWPALQFQPYFTAASANVAYGWWSHDIGGHMGGPTAPELYARWVQFGAYSPCLRLHATKDARAERRPWLFPPDVYEAAKAAFHRRYRLIPYLYTMARVTADTGRALCRPMYYEYPEEEAAYAARYQYLFGDQAIAAPIVHPADPETGMASVDVWIPPGSWIDYHTKESWTGPRWVRLVGDLQRAPLLVRQGAILPLAAPWEKQPAPRMASGTSDDLPHDRLVLAVFPGEGRFRLYEDDGVGEGYRQGQYEWTTIQAHVQDGASWTVRIDPVEGRCDALPGERSYEVRFEGSCYPGEVTLDGEAVRSWSYDPDSLTTVVQVPRRDKRKPVTVTITAEDAVSALGEAHNTAVLLSDLHRLLGPAYPRGMRNFNLLLEAALSQDVPGHADVIARLGGPFARVVEFTTPEETAQQLGRVIVGAPANAGDPYDLEVNWTLQRAGKTERHAVQLQGLAEPRIVDAPFRFDGRVQPMQWDVEIRLTWRGQSWVRRHRSRPLFPAIPTWHGLIYDRGKNPVPMDKILPGPSADWKTFSQKGEGLRNLNQPYAVQLAQEYKEQLGASRSLAGYLATRIVSPDEREAMILFRAGGNVRLYLNGVELPHSFMQDSGLLPPFFRQVNVSALARLQAGENLLVFDTQPDGKNWFFGAAVVGPHGELMTDLVIG